MKEKQFRELVEKSELRLFDLETKPDEFKGERNQLKALARNAARAKVSLSGSEFPNAVDLMYDDYAKEIFRLMDGKDKPEKS